MRSNFCILFFLSLASAASGQEIFRLENALDRALNNHFSVRIARNISEMKDNNASPGNAGMLPMVNAEGAYTSSTNSTKQTYSNGTEINKDNAKQTVSSGGVVLDWVLFDGMKMFASYDRLKELSEQGKIDFKIQVENVIEEVYKVYFGLVRETQLLKALRETFVFYEDRLKIAENKYSIGSSSKLDFLQSKVDLNAQQAAILRQEENLVNAQTELNRLLVFSVDSNYSVEDTIVIRYHPDYAALKAGLTNNFHLRSIEKNIHISRYSFKEIRSQRFPVLSGNAGYLFSDSRNDAGFFLSNRTTSVQFGITARYNLFNGMKTNNAIKNARLDLMNSQLLYDQASNSLNADFIIAFEHFKKSNELLRLEEDNIHFARENAFVFTESFRLGSANALQVKQSQESLNAALSRLVNARYETKIAEITLMKLTGQLVK